jgi:hypothetical protein
MNVQTRINLSERGYTGTRGEMFCKVSGECLNSDAAPIRVHDGEYVVVHPIELNMWRILDYIGKLVVVRLKSGECLIKELVRYCAFNPDYIILSFFVPTRTQFRVYISQIVGMWVVDEVLPADYIRNHTV